MNFGWNATARLLGWLWLPVPWLWRGCFDRPACRDALAARQKKTVEQTAELEEAGAI